jgi:hypothetical protein
MQDPRNETNNEPLLSRVLVVLVITSLFTG